MTTENGVLFSKPLTLGAVAQMTSRDLYVATKVFPIVLTNSLKGTYKYFNQEDLTQFAVELRKPGSSYKNISVDVKEQAYLCKGYGLKYSLPIEHEEELGGEILQTGANLLYDNGLKVLEYTFADTYMKTCLWGTDADKTSAKWSGAGDPIVDVKNAKIQIRKAGKGNAEYAVLTEDVFSALCENDSIIARMAVDTFREIHQEQQVAQILGLREIYVLRETTTTGMFLLFAKNPVAPTENPNAGLIMIRNYAHEVADAKGIGITNPYFDEDTDSKVIKLKLRFDMITPAPTLGYLLYNLV